FLHDGRQPGQFDRQPRAVRGGLCAVREPGRSRPDDLLLHCRGRTSLDVLALADRGALESHILIRAMNDEAQDLQNPSSPGEASPQPEPARAPAAKKKRSKAAATAEIEARIGYKFKDSALLTTAFMHVSALKPATRHRRQLPAAGVPRRPCPRADRLRHA